MALWQVQLYSQSTANLCWEACARMMWQWHFKNLNAYSQKAGSYPSLNRGLTEPEMDRFYKSLGLRSLTSPKGKNLRLALGWSPVIFTDINKQSGHAMVLTGFDGTNYKVLNPCAVLSIDFDSGTDVCSGGALNRTPAQVEKPLGHYIWYW